jgi:RecA-family ATPase
MTGVAALRAALDEENDQSVDALDDFRASVAADLAAGPEAVDAAEAPTFIVEGILPACGANLAGAGGSMKTTTTIAEGIAICLGGTLYGREIIKQRPCVIVTAEDGAAYGRYLLRRALEDGLALGKITDRGAAMAKAGVRFVSWPRARFGAIALVDRDGNLDRARRFDTLLELLAPIDPAMVTLDPLALLGPGERFGNDADAFVAAMAHEAAQALGACVQFVDHVSQAVARGGIIDQHAARGGSAKTDNARLARQLVRVESLDGAPLPRSATPEDLAERRLLALHTTKLNYAPRPPVQYLRRTGYWIEALRSLRPEEAEEARAAETRRLREAEAVAVMAAVCGALTRGEFPTARSIEDAGVIEADGGEMTRAAIRRAIAMCRRDGRLLERPLPPGHARGARQTYLDASTQP